MMNQYQDRYHAGRVLAEQLKEYANKKNTIVLALPRGGVPVAYEVATALHLPLDLFIVRKLGVPGHAELAMGALAINDTVVFNDEIIRSLSISRDEIEIIKQKEKAELERRLIAYRGKREYPDLSGRHIILVDDGIATGASMRAALKALHQLRTASIVVAVPVADQGVIEDISLLADVVVCPLIPRSLNAVGMWYQDFSQTEDEEVLSLLKQHSQS